MNNHYSSQWRLKYNIRERMLLDKKYDRDSSSSDSEFSDSYDCRLDDDLNAMMKQAKLKKKIKEEQLSMTESHDDRMERNVQLADCVVVVKHEVELDPETALGNTCSEKVDENQDVNDETIIAETSQLNESEMAERMRTIVNDVKESNAFARSLSLSFNGNNSVEGEKSPSVPPTPSHLPLPDLGVIGDSDWTDCESDFSVECEIPPLDHSTPIYSDLPGLGATDGSDWTDCDSDLTDTNFTSRN